MSDDETRNDPEVTVVTEGGTTTVKVVTDRDIEVIVRISDD